MLDPIYGILSSGVIILMIGFAFGQIKRSEFSARWLFVAVALVILNDMALTNGYGVLPNFLPNSSWNWQGKFLALMFTLAIAAHPAFGFVRVGLTLKQNPEGRKITWLAALFVSLVFAGLALWMPNDGTDIESLAFQLTMPGFEEEPYYRGILLFALNEAFRNRIKIGGVNLGWGALLSCMVFGLGHALSFSDGMLSIDPMTMGLTAMPALLLIWFRERTGSLVLPILLHNFANAIFRII